MTGMLSDLMAKEEKDPTVPSESMVEIVGLEHETS
jgi:hypothetical protein